MIATNNPTTTMNPKTINFKLDPVNNPSTNLLIYRVLKQLGIRNNMRGYYYLKDAITMGLQDMECIRYITKLTYPDIAERYGVTIASVERNIRTAIKNAEFYNKPLLIEVLGLPSSDSDHYTNKDFVFRVLTLIDSEYKIF